MHSFTLVMPAISNETNRNSSERLEFRLYSHINAHIQDFSQQFSQVSTLNAISKLSTFNKLFCSTNKSTEIVLLFGINSRCTFFFRQTANCNKSIKRISLDRSEEKKNSLNTLRLDLRVLP